MTTLISNHVSHPIRPICEKLHAHTTRKKKTTVMFKIQSDIQSYSQIAQMIENYYSKTIIEVRNIFVHNHDTLIPKKNNQISPWQSHYSFGNIRYENSCKYVTTVQTTYLSWQKAVLKFPTSCKNSLESKTPWDIINSGNEMNQSISLFSYKNLPQH